MGQSIVKKSISGAVMAALLVTTSVERAAAGDAAKIVGGVLTLLALQEAAKNRVIVQRPSYKK